MIEINITFEEKEPGNVLMSMFGEAHGEDYTKNEANYADVVSEAVKNAKVPTGDHTILADIYRRVGK